MGQRFESILLPGQVEKIVEDNRLAGRTMLHRTAPQYSAWLGSVAPPVLSLVSFFKKKSTSCGRALDPCEVELSRLSKGYRFARIEKMVTGSSLLLVEIDE